MAIVQVQPKMKIKQLTPRINYEKNPKLSKKDEISNLKKEVNKNKKLVVKQLRGE
jgi:hypothetical protein